MLFLTAMIAMILIRNIRRDISRYNRLPTEDEKVRRGRPRPPALAMCSEGGGEL